MRQTNPSHLERLVLEGAVLGGGSGIDRRLIGARLPVCNEFMLAVLQGSVLAAFPDLITVFDKKSALPLSSTQVRSGGPVTIFAVPARRLRLSSPMADRTLLRPIERLLNIKFPATAPLQQNITVRSGS